MPSVVDVRPAGIDTVGVEEVEVLVLLVVEVVVGPEVVVGVRVVVGVKVVDTVVPTVVVTIEVTVAETVAVVVMVAPVPPPPTLIVTEEVMKLVTVTVVVDMGTARPHDPNCDWQPPPQKESSLPQKKNWEQQRPKRDPAQVVVLPHMPFVDIWRGVTGGSEVAVEDADVDDVERDVDEEVVEVVVTGGGV